MNTTQSASAESAFTPAGDRQGPEVLVIGSLNMDLTVHVEVLPAPGATVMGQRLRTSPGGKGANQAMAASLAGAPTRMVGRVGRDAGGEATDGRGVVSEAPTGAALGAVDASGRPTIVGAPGPNASPSAGGVEAAAPWFVRAGMLVLQHEGPVGAVGRTAAQAASLGIP